MPCQWSLRAMSASTALKQLVLKKSPACLRRQLEILVLKQMIRTLMTTYLGARTADRVLSGAIRRGGSDSVHAVLW